MSDPTEKVEKNRTPWPKHPISGYTSADAGEWGYLVYFTDGSYEFIEEKPPIDAIEKRWGYQLKSKGV